MKRLLLVVPIALAAGCRVGPDYRPPEMPVDSSYGAGPATPATQPAATAPAATSTDAWWKLLGDPKLDQLVDRAIAANLDLKVAQARISEARAQRLVVGAEDMPQVDAAAAITRTQLSRNAAPYNAFKAPGFPWTFNTYQAGFDAAWELDVFGGARRDQEAATADLQAAIEQRSGVLLSVIGEVGRNYVELRGFQQQLLALEENLRLQRQTLELTSEQAQKGVATELDVVRAQAQVATTEALVPLVRTQQQRAIYRIVTLLGAPLEPLATELATASDIPLPPQTLPIGVPANLLRRRPDIRQAERELASATARVGSATADLYPKFSLTGVFNLQSQTSGKFFRDSSFAWAMGPAVSWPVFDAGRLRAVVKVRSAQQEQALLRYEQTVRQAIEDVRGNAEAFANTHDQRLALERAVQANRSAVELASQLYSKGLGDFLSVLDAQRQLTLTQEALARSRAAESTSLIALCKGLGGGWESQEPPAPAASTGSSSR